MATQSTAPLEQQNRLNRETESRSDLLDEVLAKTASRLDEMTSRFVEAIYAPNLGRLQKAFITAKAIDSLRRAITPDMMKHFLPLQGSALGFRTDKDKDGGYPEATVKECLIAALLDGAYPTGNEFNIIAGRTYITKEGYARKVREITGLTDLDLSIGVPGIRDGRTVVRCGATWKVGGAKRELLDHEGKPGKVFPIRVNQGMGDDAVIGKATRKTYKAIYDLINGSEQSLPDGEIEDIGETSTAQPGQSRTAKVASDLKNMNNSVKPPEPENPAVPSPASPAAAPAAPKKTSGKELEF